MQTAEKSVSITYIAGQTSRCIEVTEIEIKDLTTIMVNHLEELSSGAEGTVYSLPSQGLPSPYVLKVLHNMTTNKRDKIEALYALGVEKPHLHQILTLPRHLACVASQGKVNYILGYIMDYQEAEQNNAFASMKKLLKSNPLGALDLFDNLRSMFECLHENGVVVGDPNPHNFLLSPDGAIKLIDTDGMGINSLDVTMRGRIDHHGRSEAGAITAACDNYFLYKQLVKLLIHRSVDFNAKIGDTHSTLSPKECRRQQVTIFDPKVEDGTDSLDLLEQYPAEVLADFRAVFVDHARHPVKAETIQALYNHFAPEEKKPTVAKPVLKTNPVTSTATVARPTSKTEPKQVASKPVLKSVAQPKNNRFFCITEKELNQRGGKTISRQVDKDGNCDLLVSLPGISAGTFELYCVTFRNGKGALHELNLPHVRTTRAVKNKKHDAQSRVLEFTLSGRTCKYRFKTRRLASSVGKKEF